MKKAFLIGLATALILGFACISFAAEKAETTGSCQKTIDIFAPQAQPSESGNLLQFAAGESCTNCMKQANGCCVMVCSTGIGAPICYQCCPGQKYCSKVKC
jgi:hypothetical protein